MIKYKDQEYKIVVCTPAGREKYLSVFKKFIYRKMDEGVIDGWQLWLNTVDVNDIAYIHNMEAENPKVKVFRQGEPIDSLGFYETFNPLKTHLFFQNAQDDDTIYIRFDDDIIWAADDAIEKICQARIDNPKAFVVTPNIVNSTICNSYHQDNGALSEEAGKVKRYTLSNPDYAYLDEFNYSDSRLADHIHNTFRKHYEEGTLSAYHLPSRSYDEYQRFSICSVCWFGKDKISLGYIEEPQIAWELPQALNRPNYFVGDALLVHYAYHTQRPYFEATGNKHLEFYKTITK
ncbi:hypothetical protein M0R04_14065 [Candidatus Dojkabacteria bacterium]|jgi:hypothetical protein|nr:hypothetical protein [Candidatus Dojkabacteria bacterium]